MTVRWVVNDTAFSLGLGVIVVGGLLLIAAGFLVSFPLTLLSAALRFGGGLLLGAGARPHRVPSVSGRDPSQREADPRAGTTAVPSPEEDNLGPESPEAPMEDPFPPADAPAADRTPIVPGAGWNGVSALGPAPPAAPSLLPEEPPWPPASSTPISLVPHSDQDVVSGPTGAGGVEGMRSEAGTLSMGPPSFRGPIEDPGGPSAAAVTPDPLGTEPLADPEVSPRVKWSGPSLPFAAATDRSQGIRGSGSGASETWPPVLDRGEEDLREEVERLRQRVEELTTPVLVPGFTVLPSLPHRDALGLVTRVPEPPMSAPRATGLCSACGDADPPGPSGGHRCWGCGRAVCSNCFWRYGPGPALHRCPSCAGNSPALTISGGRRSRAPGTPSSGGDEAEWTEGL